MSADLIPQRPYLLRAMHEWMTDNGQTPHIVVNALIDGVEVPPQHIQDGKIILNVSHAAVRNLSLGDEQIRFEARFAGTPHQVSVPISAVMGIYARESSQGMVFSDEKAPPPDDENKTSGADGKKASAAGAARPQLRVIK